MKVEYRSNNSGGIWWLNDEDWKKLEKNGWHIIWGGYEFCNRKPEIEKQCKETNCHGHRRYSTAKEAEKDRWLGALAQYAFKEFSSIDEAKEDWRRIVNQDPEEEGCNCCGQPHNFN